VTARRRLVFTFAGPGRVRIVARVDFDDGLHGAQVKELVRGIEPGMKQKSEDGYRSTSCPLAEHGPSLT